MKKKKKKSLNQSISDFDSDKIIDSFDQGKVPESLEFFYRGENKSFYLKCKLLDLNKGNKRFIEFFRIMHKNKLIIHTETVNSAYDNLNMDESIYAFILGQQGTSKKLLDANFSFCGDFQCYIKEYLGGIDSDDNKYNALTNKNSKYLFYRYNDF